MKKNIYFLIALLTVLCTANAQVLRPFTARYNNASVRGNIVYVSNSIVNSTGGINTEVAPNGSSTNNGKPAVYIDVDNPAPVIKSAFNLKWDYHANNAAPPNDGGGNTWKVPAYVLNGPWNVNAAPVTGTAKYGFGGTQNTCLPSGQTPICSPGPGGTKYNAYYFRKTVSFTATELSTTFGAIRLDMLRNDGIVVYINGVERIRNNMPTGTIIYGTAASADITVGAAEALSVDLSPTFFTTGVNTIAVEVHLRTTNSNNMGFDMQVSGVETFSSSTSDLSLPACSKILFAGLYWGASQGSGGTDISWRLGETKVKFKIPGAPAYTFVTSSQTDYHDGTLVPGLPHTGYRCFADITSLVNATNPNGTYTVANVVGPLGINNGSGGWTIVIAYSNPSQQPRNLTVFDGSAIMNGGDPAMYVGVNGFLTPPSGPVSCELGAVVYDGDRASVDEFSFKQNSNPVVGTYINQTPNTTSKINDMWNSTISYKGNIITTRNPAFQNTLGYDADIIDVPNAGNAVLGNSQTSASIRFSSPSENYFIHEVSTSISIYNPSFAFDKTATDINGGATVPGDSLRYQANYSNVGNDASTNSVIIDNIPLGTTYIPGSLKINGVAKTDVSGDDQADYDVVNNRVIFRIGTGATAATGGIVPTAITGNVQFDVILASSCNVLSCTGSVQNTARINYVGQTSGSTLFDSSGVNVAGCVTPGPVVTTPVGSCYTPGDTLLVNNCPVTSMMIPWRKYAGYVIYSAQPFIAANRYNPLTPVTSSHVYWAYFDNGFGCSDTIRINMILTRCPDIDDDNDGIPDYVEFNDPRATATTAGVPHWNDPAYAGYVDHNADNVNDNFDWGADSDNDGIVNFRDKDFWLGFVDTNGDGVNDKSDRDLDGIPNQYDLDSDNDGIPDVVESYGVDVNGDGIIDNYIDTDNDGFSQNVDFNNTGVSGSRNGLDAIDLDGDGVPNYLDSDSDNDGIPDVIEVGGTDADNDGMIDGFTDVDGDGFSDNVDGDVGNNGVAENTANTLLTTGLDVTPVNGRADNYPKKNMDNDKMPNPYDLDSDGDGITDVIEAANGFLDTDFNGQIDAAINTTTGWSTVVDAMPTLTLRNTDGRGNPDYLDIDADDDGIPDNIEGQTTNGYRFPAYADSDGDGIDDAYDFIAGFGGSGILLSNKDGDALPDYRDLDTDQDGQPDIIEGNDFNRNGLADDDVSLTFLDTDGDGLDNRFDSLTSVINLKGSSYNMGVGGIPSGDLAPGARTPVQKTISTQTDRDWRYTSYVLYVKLLQLSGVAHGDNVSLTWNITTTQAIEKFEIERSIDNINFNKIQTLVKDVPLDQLKTFAANDDIAGLNNEYIFYRLKVVTKNGQVTYSNVLLIKKSVVKQTIVNIHPNPAADYVMVGFNADKDYEATIKLIDNLGKIVISQKQRVSKGMNSVPVTGLSRFSNATYILQVILNDQVVTQKLVIQNR